MRPYLGIDGGHWSDGLIGAMAPASDGPLPADEVGEEEMPELRPRDGWRQLRWIQSNRPGMDAEHLMRRYGVPIRDRCYPLQGPVRGKEVGFDVPARQAAWAEYLLCRAGFALTTPLLDERNQAALERAHSEGASRPVGGGRIRRQGIVAKYYGFMDELLGVGENGRERTAPMQTSWQRRIAGNERRGARGVRGWLYRIFGVTL